MPSCCVYILLLFRSNYFHSFLKLALLRQFTILIDSEILIPMVIWLLFVAFPVSKTIQLLSRERERSLVWMCFHWIYLCVLCRYLRLEIISHKSFGFFSRSIMEWWCILLLETAQAIPYQLYLFLIWLLIFNVVASFRFVLSCCCCCYCLTERGSLAKHQRRFHWTSRFTSKTSRKNIHTTK